MPAASGPFSGIEKRHILKAMALAMAFLFLGLSACTSQNRMPGYIYFRIAADPSNLDPAMITDVTGGSIAAKLFNGLVRIGPGLKIIPDMAQSWDVSKDGLSYTFRLKKGVKFSNGREVTADDFRYSFERLLNKETASPNTWVLERLKGAKEFSEGRAAGIEGIEVVNPYTLRLTLSKPFSPFLDLLAMTAAYVVPKELAGDRFAFGAHPVGTGPYVLQKWASGQEVVLLARDDYFDGHPKVKGIVYRIIPEDLTAVVEFELGNLDVISVPASMYSQFRADPKWKGNTASIDGINTYYLGLNCSRPPFNNKKLREAVSCAIDRKKILRTFMEGRGTLASGPVPPALRDWPRPKGYPYNPEKARQLLKEAGYKNGLTVSFYITAQEEVADMAEIIQSYLSQVGIHARIKQLEWNAYREALNNGESDIFWISWWADYPDPENFLYPLFDSANKGPAGNRTFYENPRVDRLIAQGQSARDTAERDRYYQRAEQIIVDDAPWVPFWHRKDIMLRQPYVKNYTIYPVYSMDKGLEVSLF